MKKVLSVLLMLIIVFSSITTGVWANGGQTEASANLMEGYTYNDWRVTSRATINAPTDSYSGDKSNAFSVTKLMWRSAYTSVDLEAGETYELSFYYKEDAPSKVWVRDDYGIMMAPKSALKTTGETITFLSGDTSSNLLNGLDCKILSDKEGWYVINTEITASVSGEHLLYFTGAAASDGSGNGNLDLIHFSDFSLVKRSDDYSEVVTNVLNDDAMARLSWKAIWNTGLRDPKTADLDKSQSYSGEAYAMTMGSNSRWRDNYINVTLQPNTTYNFSFRYKSGTNGEYVNKIGFIDASKVDFTTYEGDTVESHRTDSQATVLGKDAANIEKNTDGSWNLVSTTFVTTEAVNYVMFINVQYPGGTFTTITFSDFGLVCEQEAEKDPNVLNSNTMSGLTWTALWSGTPASSKRDPKTAVLDKSQSYSGEGYAMTWGSNSRYRDNYTVVTLEANTTYNLSFYYKSGTAEECVAVIGFVDSSKLDLSTVKSDYVSGHFTDSSKPVLGKDASIGSKYDGSWNEVTTTFTTTDATEYVMYMHVTFTASKGSFSALTLSDFSLTAQTEDDDDEDDDDELTDPNRLNDTVMSTLTWTSLWSGTPAASKRDPKTADLDKSQSYSGEGYAMTWGSNSRYRDNYTVVTLEANTTYNLSFYYKSGTAEECVAVIGFVDSSKLDLSTIKSDFISGHFTDSSKPVLGKDASIGKKYDGSWNEVTTTFTTTDATEYVMYMNVSFTASKGSFSTLTLSDFSLVVNTNQEDDKDDEDDADNVLASTKASDWTSSWGPTTATNMNGGIYVKSAYRSVYTKVTLEPNVAYHFSFNYENVRVKDIRVYDAAEITDPAVQLYSDPTNGSFVEGGKNNIAIAQTTTDCESPVNGVTYSAFEEFTTTDATEYYIILDTDLFSTTSILLKNVSLKKFYDPKTDVYGTVTVGAGGTATGKGKLSYTKGEEVTFVATPNEGNAFEGWFDAENNKVSSDVTYTFVVTEEFVLTAKFSGGNIPYVDWIKVNGMDGTFENGTMSGWYAVDPSNGNIVTWPMYTVTDKAAHSGKKSLAVQARYQRSCFEFDDLSKNTDYYLSFYIYTPASEAYDSEADVGSKGFKVNEISLSLGSDEYWNKSNLLMDGNQTWHRVELFFNTGDSNSAKLCIYYDADPSATGGFDNCVYLDDVSLVQYFADGLDNGDFANGKLNWMGDLTVEDGIAALQNGKKFYQSVKVDDHSLYTVSFKAKGELTAVASKINKYSVSPIDLITSQSSVTTSGEWYDYSFDVYTGMNSALNLVFEALADNAEVDDIKIVKQDNTEGAIVEKIDFETDRFAFKNHYTNSDVYEIYEGEEFAHSGNKSLHFKYDATDENTEYPFKESYLGFQISNKCVYRLTFYYKTSKGNSIKISPDFLGEQAGSISVVQTAKSNGWNRIDFFASSTSALYFDPIIASIVSKTNADFYVDDITYSIVSAAVLGTNVEKVYAEPPLALLYNEGFEEPITAQNWGKLPTTMKVVEGDAEFGNKYLKVSGNTFYVLPVEVEAGAQYYLSASLRGTDGYIGLSTTADGKGLFAGISGKIESFIDVTSKKWERKGIKFSAPVNGVVYLVIACDDGTFDLDNVLIYKEQYGLTSKPNGHNISVAYDYNATSGKNYVLNGGYTVDGSVENSQSPSTGDTFPAALLIMLTLFSVAVLLLTSKKIKKEAE